MKSVVCWLWNDIGARAYKPKHVNVLRKMFARHLAEPHRFICVADSAEGFDKEVEVFKTPPEAAEAGRLRTPERPNFPSCYRRLWMFSEGAKALGERVLLIDIDLVVVRDVLPLFEHTEEFVGWRPYRDWGAQLRFGGGIYLLTPGTRRHVWDDFQGPVSIAKARAAGFRGSDQAWLSYCLGKKEVYFPKTAGVYSIRDMTGREYSPPHDARIIQFNGPVKPWASPLGWVNTHWR